jgi:putative hydrolase of HD superfamily
MKGLIRFLYEVGHLKNVPRAGWTVMGIASPESVAEHSYRTTIIGYVLAHLEQADVEKTVLMCLFHDVHEARLTDLHRLARKYVDWQPVETKAIAHVLKRLPDSIADHVGGALAEFNRVETLEARIAKDADRLEFIFQAVEYQARGHGDLGTWIEQNRQDLRTASARKLAEECLEQDLHCWWNELDAAA